MCNSYVHNVVSSIDIHICTRAHMCINRNTVQRLNWTVQLTHEGKAFRFSFLYRGHRYHLLVLIFLYCKLKLSVINQYLKQDTMPFWNSPRWYEIIPEKKGSDLLMGLTTPSCRYFVVNIVPARTVINGRVRQLRRHLGQGNFPVLSSKTLILSARARWLSG